MRPDERGGREIEGNEEREGERGPFSGEEGGVSKGRTNECEEGPSSASAILSMSLAWGIHENR